MNSPVDEKIYFTLVTAGHVDHGKSSLIKSLTNINPDRLPEEKIREMTIDIGYAFFQSDYEVDGQSKKIYVGFVDVPGHEKFAKNMLSGVTPLDLALLVVDAKESVKQQTIEHVKILKYLDYRDIIVVVSKCDISSVEQINLTIAQVKSLLDIYQLTYSHIIEFDIFDNQKISYLKQCILQNCIDSYKSRNYKAKYSRSALMPIDRVFNKQGHGLVVTGSLISGSIKIGDSLNIYPNRMIAKVRAIECFNEKVDSAICGSRVALNLNIKSGDLNNLSRGCLISREELCDTSILYVAIDINKTEINLKSSFDVDVYYNCAKYSAKLIKFGDFFKLKFLDKIFCLNGDNLIIKLKDKNILGGKILANDNLVDFPKTSLITILDYIKSKNYLKAILEIVLFKKIVHKDFLKLIFSDEILSLISDSECNNIIACAQDLIISKTFFDEIGDKIIQIISSCPNGISKAEIYNQTLNKYKEISGFDISVVRLCLQNLFNSNIVSLKDDYVYQANSTDINDNMVLIENYCRNYFVVELENMAYDLKLSKDSIKDYLKKLQSLNRVFVLDETFVAHAQTIAKSQNVLAKLWQINSQISPSSFKSELDTTRKYALPLLQFFDNRFITRFHNNTRILNPNKFIKF